MPTVRATKEAVRGAKTGQLVDDDGLLASVGHLGHRELATSSTGEYPDCDGVYSYISDGYCDEGELHTTTTLIADMMGAIVATATVSITTTNAAGSAMIASTPTRRVTVKSTATSRPITCRTATVTHTTTSRNVDMTEETVARATASMTSAATSASIAKTSTQRATVGGGSERPQRVE
ncbi:unnamed protein product [Ectocarpus fasciculatus]